jgi:hypothetical protein
VVIMQTIVNQFGNIYYSYNGQLHREDGPAIEYKDGRKDWYLHGQRHREDGPAIEHPNDCKQWWFHGKLHRTDGPAIEYLNGGKEWYLHDAIEYGVNSIKGSAGTKEWYLNGQKYSEEDYWRVVKLQALW